MEEKLVAGSCTSFVLGPEAVAQALPVGLGIYDYFVFLTFIINFRNQHLVGGLLEPL